MGLNVIIVHGSLSGKSVVSTEKLEDGVLSSTHQERGLFIIRGLGYASTRQAYGEPCEAYSRAHMMERRKVARIYQYIGRKRVVGLNGIDELRRSE